MRSIVVQLGLRPSFRWLPSAAAVVPWLIVVALAPLLLGPSPYLVLADLSLLDFVLLALTYPLLRLPALAATSPDRQAGSAPASAA